MLKIDDRVGTIAAGKWADIVATDDSPLDNIKTMETVTFVMKGGEIYKSIN